MNKVKLYKKRLANDDFQLERKETKEKSVESVKKSSPLNRITKKAGHETSTIIDKILSLGEILKGWISVNALYVLLIM